MDSNKNLLLSDESANFQMTNNFRITGLDGIRVFEKRRPGRLEIKTSISIIKAQYLDMWVSILWGSILITSMVSNIFWGSIVVRKKWLSRPNNHLAKKLTQINHALDITQLWKVNFITYTWPWFRAWCILIYKIATILIHKTFRKQFHFYNGLAF